MIKAFRLPPVKFAFHGGQTRTDKLRGLQELGPFRSVPDASSPRFGFVFPNESKDRANALYLALKNGIGYFKGIENTFRLRLEKDFVFPISNFSLSGMRGTSMGRAYTDAILSWTAKNARNPPDLFFLIHPKTAHFEVGTPYYACKAALLQEGILSQSVTQELLDDRSQFEWAAANLALGAFVKLGGVPWVVSSDEAEDDLIIGIGRSSIFDHVSRNTTHYIAFTACFSARGAFKFVALADVAKTHQDYLVKLQEVVGTSLTRAEQLGTRIASLSVHMPKEMGREEGEAIQRAVAERANEKLSRVVVAKVTDEANSFAVDDQYPDGAPKRGTVIRISDRDYVLYTEGRDEKETWRARIPGAVRVSPQRVALSHFQSVALLRQINDLSQVNWRGFNARSRPISVAYGHLIAEILSHVPEHSVKLLYRAQARRTLEERMWFL